MFTDGCYKSLDATASKVSAIIAADDIIQEVRESRTTTTPKKSTISHKEIIRLKIIYNFPII